MKLLAVLLSLMLAITPAFAQRGDMKGAGKQQGMSKDQREGLRRDVRDFNQDRNRQDRPPQRQLTPEERQKLRRDIEGANKDMRR
jgi:uncharacterized membrane protein